MKGERMDTFENKLEILEKFNSPSKNGCKNRQIEDDFWDVPEVINQMVTIDPKDIEEKITEKKVRKENL